MSRILRCNSIVPGCSAEVRAETDDEIMRQAAEHARTAHGLEQIDQQTAEKIRAAITTEV